ncbi:IS3 family transposase, partial [Brachybacterium tyrofermentans]|uniref:IS3 family transposase n=1 Tax=Brachybacterium tyrofermentans TaxID=47848 RepID=UPI003FCEF26B
RSTPAPAKSRVDNYRSVNAMMESFWSSMQIELLNRKKWNTRIELANAIFEYIEVFYNRRRRHSSLEYATPNDYDLARTPQALATTGS